MKRLSGLTNTNCVGTIEIEKQIDFIVYPNPVQNSININAEENINKIVVTSMLGKKMIVKSANSNSTVLNTASLKSGVYVVNVYTNKGVGTKLIVKEILTHSNLMVVRT